MKEFTAERWKKVNRLFQEIIELSPEQQEKRVEEIRQGDSDLAADLKKLLNAHHQSSTFMSGTVADDLTILQGERVGPWEIAEEIGRGGMSTVYLAHRADGRFDRKVAVKFLHGLFPGKHIAERMKDEQMILAQLDHEHICKLLDAGVTTAGRPYFIMEFIDGVPIDQYCMEQNLSVSSILDLFEQVCEAVRYAHQRLIVHRDLKPGNIMVDVDGRVKLLDFGISKIVSEEPELDITNTKTALHLMTPEYASPEQVRYDPVTTSTDIYSLGLILCKLLTGRFPYDVEKKSPLDIGHTILESAPTKPSTLVISQKLNDCVPDPAELLKSLKGDLDNIILMALRKDPARRYSSVDQLLRDIRNFRSDRPVLARPESLGYLTSKFVKRNRVAVGSAAAIAAVLCFAAIFSIHQASVANEQRQIAESRLLDVQDLTGSLMFDIHDAIVPLPGSTPARELIAAKASEYLESLSEIEGNDDELNFLLAASYRKIGDLLGNPTTANLGRGVQAIESYELAETSLERIEASPQNQPELDRQQALILEKKSDVLISLGETEQAEVYQRQSAELFRRLMEETDDPETEFSYAVSLLKLGDVMGHPNFNSLGLPDSSLHYYRSARDIFDRYASDHKKDMRAIRYSGLIYERMSVIQDYLGADDDALENLKISADFRERFIEMDPLNMNAIRDKAIIFEKMAKIYQQKGNLAEAKAAFEQAFDTYRWLMESDPQNTSAAQTVAVSHIHLGDLANHSELPSFGDRELARDHFNASKQILSGLFKNDSTNARTAFLLDLVNRRLR